MSPEEQLLTLQLEVMFDEIYQAGLLPRPMPGMSADRDYDANVRKDDIVDLVREMILQLAPPGIDKKAFLEKIMLDPEMQKALIMTMHALANLPAEQFQQLKGMLDGSNPNPENTVKLQEELEKNFLAVFKNILTSLNKNLPPEQRASEEMIEKQAQELTKQFVSNLLDPNVSAKKKFETLLTPIMICHEVNKKKYMPELEKPEPGQAKKPGEAAAQLPAIFAASQMPEFMKKGIDTSVLSSFAIALDLSTRANPDVEKNILNAEKAIATMTPELVGLLKDEGMMNYNPPARQLRPR